MKDESFLYILDGHTPVPVDDLTLWGEWTMDITNRRVAFDTIDGVEVSTVFLSYGFSHGLRDKPLLFETMIFTADPDVLDLRKWNYATWDEAVRGHQHALRVVRRTLAMREREEKPRDVVP